VTRLLRPAALLLVLLCVGVARADGPSFQNLEESLTCQCGCGLTVHSCNHLQCPSAIPLRREIRQQMALGKNREQILAYFADKYGEKILSSPTTSGFNLAAWVTPFLAMILGGIFVTLTIVRWRRPASAGAREPDSTPQPADLSAHEKTLERELERLEP
jgi:cytochrome c-type biogenesis protein CcmH